METAALSFERAWVLNALWLLPLVVALFWWAERSRRSAIGRIVAPKLRAMLAGSASPARRWFRSACVILAMGLLIAALAGPRLGYDTLETPHRGRDVVIAVDVSRSMLAPDVAPTRLERAKLFVEDLVDELGADRIGLVAFAGSAFLQAPLTLDHGAVLAATDELDTSLIPKGGTNLAAAIDAADEAFGKAEGFSRAVVIISDGEELSADGVAAAKKAAAQGIRIFTVGVGSTGGSEIPDGMGELIRDPDTGKIVNSKLDEARMKEIAEATGGFYTHLDDKSAAQIALQGIAKMDEADFAANSSRRPIERYQWPLGAAIALLMLQALVGERRRRRALAMMALAALMLPAAAWAAPAGIEAYNQGNYEKAREAFEQRLRMEPDAPALQLNAGAAAYRLKDYAKASQYFSRAALSDDATVRSAAEFNFANTLFRQGEGQQDTAKKIADWKEAVAKYDTVLKARPDHTEAKENKERVEQLLKELEKQQQQEQKQQQQQKKDDKQQKQDQNQQQQQQQGGDQKDQQQKKDQQSESGQGSDQQKKDQQDKGQQQKNEEKSGGQSQQQKDQQQGGQKKDEGQSGSEGGQKEQQKKDDEQKGGGEKEGKPEEQKGGKPGEEKKDQGQQGEEGEQPQQPPQSGQQGNPQQGKPGEERAPAPQQSGEKKEGELKSAGQPGQSEGKEQEQAAIAEEEEDGKMNESQARALLRSLQGEEDKVNLLERRAFQDVSKDW